MIQRDDILAAVGQELDDVLAGAAPEHLSEAGLKSIRESALAYASHVLAALTTQEMQSAGAYDRFLENVLAETRMRMHEQGRGRS